MRRGNPVPTSLRATAVARQSNQRRDSLLLDCHVVATPRNDRGRDCYVVATPRNDRGRDCHVVATPRNDRGRDCHVVATPRNDKQICSSNTS